MGASAGAERQKKVDKPPRAASVPLDDVSLRRLLCSLEKDEVDRIVLGHRVDNKHESDGGCGERGYRPQGGRDMLENELSWLRVRDGVAEARGDVFGETLVLDLVRRASAVEMEYFERTSVYSMVDQADQAKTEARLSRSNGST